MGLGTGSGILFSVYGCKDLVRTSVKSLQLQRGSEIQVGTLGTILGASTALGVHKPLSNALKSYIDEPYKVFMGALQGPRKACKVLTGALGGCCKGLIGAL